MRNNKYIHLLLSVLACGCFACASSSGDDLDFSAYQGVDLAGVEDACNCPASDSTCMSRTGCNPDGDIYLAPFESNHAENINGAFEGYYGRIDDPGAGCFYWGEHGSGGDIDFIRLKSKAGAPLRVSVSPAGNSKIDPIVSLNDLNGNALLVGYTEHSETVLNFFAPGDDFYISVEDRHNQQLSIDESYQCAAKDLRGGRQYDYVMRVDKSNIMMTDLGNVSSLTTLEPRTIKDIAEIHYYKASVSLGHKLRLRIYPPKTNLCQFVYSYEVGDTHEWGIKTYHEWYSQLMSGYNTEGVIPASAAVSDGQTGVFTFMVFEFTSAGDCDYILELEAI